MLLRKKSSVYAKSSVYKIFIMFYYFFRNFPQFLNFFYLRKLLNIWYSQIEHKNRSQHHPPSSFLHFCSRTYCQYKKYVTDDDWSTAWASFQFVFFCQCMDYVQQNLIITATYGLNIFSCHIKVAALQRCKCIESHHLGLEVHVGGCNNKVAA